MKRDKTKRDPFAFSLGGMTAIGSFFISPAIADDLINEARDERLGRQAAAAQGEPQEDQPVTPASSNGTGLRAWLSGRRRAA
jgi:hypothetical protein